MTGPVAGWIASELGYPAIFLFGAVLTVGAVALCAKLYLSALKDGNGLSTIC